MLKRAIAHTAAGNEFGMIAIADDEQSTILFNCRLGKLLGYEDESLEGSSLKMILPEYIRDKHRELLIAFRDQASSSREMGKGKKIKAIGAKGEVPVTIHIDMVRVAKETAFIAYLESADAETKATAVIETQRDFRAGVDKFVARAKKRFFAWIGGLSTAAIVTLFTQGTAIVREAKHMFREIIPQPVDKPAEEKPTIAPSTPKPSNPDEKLRSLLQSVRAKNEKITAVAYYVYEDYELIPRHVASVFPKSTKFPKLEPTKEELSQLRKSDCFLQRQDGQTFIVCATYQPGLYAVAALLNGQEELEPAATDLFNAEVRQNLPK